MDVNIICDADEQGYKLIYIGHGGRRRGVYFDGLDNALNIKQYKDFSVYKIDEYLQMMLTSRLAILNRQIPQTFLESNVEGGVFTYTAIETSPSLYVARYSKVFDQEAYESIYNEYKTLSKIAVSEKHLIQRYIDIGSAMMNMLIPETDFRRHLLSEIRIMYLSGDTKTSHIPWEILAVNGAFLSNSIIFSYTHATNIFFRQQVDKHQIVMAIVKIPQDDLVCSDYEIEIIKQNKNVVIDCYSKVHTYFDFVQILERYKVVHIITHGNELGISLGDGYTLKNVSTLQNPPSLVFLSVCNTESPDNKLVGSMLSAGIPSVISGVGSMSDSAYIQFVKHFYNNMLHKDTRINTAQAYYFAAAECKSKECEHITEFLRFRFNGVPTYL